MIMYTTCLTAYTNKCIYVSKIPTRKQTFIHSSGTQQEPHDKLNLLSSAANQARGLVEIQQGPIQDASPVTGIDGPTTGTLHDEGDGEDLVGPAQLGLAAGGDGGDVDAVALDEGVDDVGDQTAAVA